MADEDIDERDDLDTFTKLYMKASRAIGRRHAASRKSLNGDTEMEAYRMANDRYEQTRANVIAYAPSLWRRAMLQTRARLRETHRRIFL